LLAKKIGLGLLAKSRFEYTGTRAANSFRPRQGRLLRVSAAILMNCNQRRHAATVHEFSTHHRSQSFGRDHDHVDVFGRNNRPVMNREAVRKEQCLIWTQVRSDLFPVNGRDLRI